MFVANAFDCPPLYFFFQLVFALRCPPLGTAVGLHNTLAVLSPYRPDLDGLPSGPLLPTLGPNVFLTWIRGPSKHFRSTPAPPNVPFFVDPFLCGALLFEVSRASLGFCFSLVFPLLMVCLVCDVFLESRVTDLELVPPHVCATPGFLFLMTNPF